MLNFGVRPYGSVEYFYVDYSFRFPLLSEKFKRAFHLFFFSFLRHDSLSEDKSVRVKTWNLSWIENE